LWLYAENDRLFPPQVIRFMHAAYAGAGGEAELIILPRLLDDGHELWSKTDGRRQWLPVLDGFLTAHGLPTWNRAALEDRIRTELKEDPSRSLIKNYLEAPLPKALALSLISRKLGVTVGAETIEAARSESVGRCERRNGELCTVVVENFDFIGEEEPERAIADLTAAIGLDPKDGGAYHKRGSLHHAKGDYDRAIQDYGEAIRLDPKNLLALNSRGLAFESEGLHDPAIADFSAVIRRDPAIAFPYKNRGLAYEKKGELTKALAELRKALFLEAPTPEAKEGAERIEKRLAASRKKSAGE
jgi:tetratricopeptide (TPR) repeat protein